MNDPIHGDRDPAPRADDLAPYVSHPAPTGRARRGRGRVWLAARGIDPAQARAPRRGRPRRAGGAR